MLPLRTLGVLDRCAKIRIHKTHGRVGGKRCQFAAIEAPGNIQRGQHGFGTALGFKRQFKELRLVPIRRRCWAWHRQIWPKVTQAASGGFQAFDLYYLIG